MKKCKRKDRVDASLGFTITDGSENSGGLVIGYNKGVLIADEEDILSYESLLLGVEPKLSDAEYEELIPAMWNL